MPIVSMSEFKPGDGDGDGGDGSGMPDGRTLPVTGPGGIYHEKQIGALCAVHAMNNLMQSRTFDEVQMSNVAMALDREERRLLGGAAVDQGGNVRADGFFNVQVISAALRNQGFTMEPISGEAARKLLNAPEKQRGFILNKREHWFSLRRIGQEWFDLNSCLKIPRHFTDRELSATVNEAVREGYTVFFVEGNFPKTELDRDGQKLLEAVQGCGHFRQGHCLFAGSGQTLGGAGPSGGAGAASSGAPAIDPELLAAAEADPDLAAAIAASLQTAAPAAKAAPAANDAAAMRAARLARFG